MFYATEIALREQLKYPPFCDIIVISFNGSNEADIKNNFKINFYKNLSKFKIYDTIETENKFKIFIPMPAPIDKIQNKYRYRIIVKGTMDKESNEEFNKCLKNIYKENLKDMRISIDVNPNSMA